MSLQALQQDVDTWTSRFKIQYWHPLAMVARLAEETGELAREVNHRWGPKQKKPAEQTQELAEEMGDIIFTVICIANSQRISLDDAWKRVMDKCYGRDKDRYEKAQPS